MLVFALLACDKTEPVDSDPGPDCEGVDYASHAEAFVEVCTGCHSARLSGSERQGAPEPLNFDPPGGVEGFVNQMVALGTGDDPAMPPDGLDAAIREDFALWAECGLPGLPAPRCAGETWEGELRLSEVPEGFCDGTRWVTGDLVVDAPAEPASCVCGVGGDLVLQTEVVLLPELVEITGELALLDSAVTTVGLPRLEVLGGRLVFEDNTALSSVDLGALERSGRVSVRDNPGLGGLTLGSLETVDGPLAVRGNTFLTQLDLSALRQVGGVIDLRDNPVLTALITPESLVGLPDGLEIANNPALDGLTGFAGLETAVGAVRIEDLSPQSVDAFGAVREVGGVQIVGLGPLDQLHAFEALEVSTGTVRVAHLAPVADLSLLGSLQRVEGGLVVDEFAGRGVVGFPSLVEVVGGLELANNPALDEIRFGALTSVGGLVVAYDPELPDLDSLQGLTSVGGTVEIHHLLGLTSLTGLDNVTVIEGGLRLEDLPALTSLAALASLEEVQGPLLVRNVGTFDAAELGTLFSGVVVQGTVTLE